MSQTPSDETGRDETEGQYTEKDGEGASEREVHGQYTETDGVGPDPSVEGAYTDEDSPAAESEGDFTRTDE
ncbi:hypothetical protein [Leifsonia sp. Leaf264]|uniref:hypothetical protein n=1 Tax=Leifsonia sp. Leaf264 TaxID=1736314 RepID=UPI0006FE8289|nr:hypothetical protein [Leifsonia sp. Leaf264]KQO95678.1 hypothetical protein ASF30_18765 [Leifsonia sp. Leaf264]